MKNITVIAPEGCAPYLTAGKEYETFDVFGDRFSIISDNGIACKCLFKVCVHIEFKDWIIKETQPNKKYHIVFMETGQTRSTGITYEAETVTGALSQFFAESPNALFLYIASEDLFKLKY